MCDAIFSSQTRKLTLDHGTSLIDPLFEVNTALLLPESRGAEARFDLLGVVLVPAAAVGIIPGLVRAPGGAAGGFCQIGWSSLATMATSGEL